MPEQIKHIIALDVGSKRIGVATVNTIALVSSPYKTIENNKQVFEAIKKISQEFNTKEIVVGLPRGLDGQETAQTKYVRDFCESIHNKTGLNVHFQDEALTSKKAEQELADRGVSYNKADVDALAAAFILDDYIEDNRNRINA